MKLIPLVEDPTDSAISRDAGESRVHEWSNGVGGDPSDKLIFIASWVAALSIGCWSGASHFERRCLLLVYSIQLWYHDIPFVSFQMSWQGNSKDGCNWNTFADLPRPDFAQQKAHFSHDIRIFIAPITVSKEWFNVSAPLNVIVHVLRQ